MKRKSAREITGVYFCIITLFEKDFKVIFNIIPLHRLKRYGHGTDSEAVVLERYAWNIELSEALYPSLSLLEVGLRNQINTALSEVFTEDWLDECWNGWVRTEWMKQKGLRNTEQESIQRAKKGLSQRANKWTKDRLIAELTFGFWVGVFKRHYHPSIWIHKKKPLNIAFPEGHSLKASIVYNKLDAIRRLRNRIAHHKTIFDLPNLLNDYQNIQTLLIAMGQGYSEYGETIDRFKTVYEKGKHLLAIEKSIK